jgi:hypothetical protein
MTRGYHTGDEAAEAMVGPSRFGRCALLRGWWPQPPRGAVRIQEDPDLGAVQQPQLRQLGPHQRPRCLPARLWHRKGAVLGPQALPTTGPLTQLLLGQQLLQHIFQLVAGPQFLHRAPLAGDRELNPQTDFVLVHGPTTLADPSVPMVQPRTPARHLLAQHGFRCLGEVGC